MTSVDWIADPSGLPHGNAPYRLPQAAKGMASGGTELLAADGQQHVARADAGRAATPPVWTSWNTHRGPSGVSAFMNVAAMATRPAARGAALVKNTSVASAKCLSRA